MLKRLKDSLGSSEHDDSFEEDKLNFKKENIKNFKEK